MLLSMELLIGGIFVDTVPVEEIIPDPKDVAFFTKWLWKDVKNMKMHILSQEILSIFLRDLLLLRQRKC